MRTSIGKLLQGNADHHRQSSRAPILLQRAAELTFHCVLDKRTAETEHLRRDNAQSTIFGPREDEVKVPGEIIIPISSTRRRWP